MFDKESQLPLRRVRWRVKLIYKPADDYGESADGYIPTGVSVLESADSELESANSSTDSNADAAKVDVWVWALILVLFCYHGTNSQKLPFLLLRASLKNSLMANFPSFLNCLQ